MPKGATRRLEGNDRRDEIIMHINGSPMMGYIANVPILMPPQHMNDPRIRMLNHPVGGMNFFPMPDVERPQYSKYKNNQRKLVNGRNSGSNSPVKNDRSSSGPTNAKNNRDSAKPVTVINVHDVHEIPTHLAGHKTKHDIYPRKLDYKRIKAQPLVNCPVKGKERVYYRLETPLLAADYSQGSAKTFVSKLLDSKRDSYLFSQPIRVADNEDCSVASLSELPSAIDRFLHHPKKSSKPKPKTIAERFAQQAYEGDDSIDLSFDGKAMDRNDVFKMVDSFSLAMDDDGCDDSITTKNILLPEICGINTALSAITERD
ncbi:LAMI_0G01156g1_1 [Lachancea mirantina]|uniref:LAMI_0G01156g1_1 n=1 Tax=Lachancea mirantina TaxID=1230905 RepID=A0A1G4K7C6_9SACH|nr:LAMI_0G01156g1_1 [Lachancea mirantina]